MGMFDYLYCEFPLPQPNLDIKIDGKTEFQTKSLTSSLEKIKIDVNGVVHHENGNTYRERGELYFGSIRFYTHVDTDTKHPEYKVSHRIEYTALVKDSKVLELRESPESSHYVRRWRDPDLNMLEVSQYVKEEDLPEGVL